jgi:hypothetical protein
MIHTLQTTLQRFNTHKVILALVTGVTIFALGFGSVASARSNGHPPYYDLDKPGDTSQCDGGNWEKKHRHWWQWWKFWGKKDHKKWVSNWERLGFNSKKQCVRFLSTRMPTSKKDCKENWWQLGFKNRGDCHRYLKLHPGGGYGG